MSLGPDLAERRRAAQQKLDALSVGSAPLSEAEVLTLRSELEALAAAEEGSPASLPGDALFELLPAGYAALAPDGTLLRLNREAARLLAAAPGQQLGALLAPGAQEACTRFLALTFASPTPQRLEASLATGATLLVEAVRAPGGRSCLVLLLDVTVRGEAERRTSSELEQLAAVIPGNIARVDSALRYCFANDHRRMFGLSAEAMLGRTLAGVLGPELFARVEPVARRALEGHWGSVEVPVREPSGAERVALVHFTPHRGEGGAVEGAFIVALDITTRKRAEAAQAEAQGLLGKISSRVPGVVYQYRLRPDGTQSFPYASERLQELFGVSPEAARGNALSVFAAVHPEDQRAFEASLRKSYAELSPWAHEFRVALPTGVRWLSGTSMPEREADGSTVWHGFISDVTGQRQLEQQYRQAQKMEAIGQLAGGVAHDFNNILGAMLLEAELLEMDSALGDEARDGLQQIRAAAARAANLTRQLLLFSRRQVMQPVQLDLNEVVTQLGKMLGRIIGEDVHLELRLYPGALGARADTGMLEQVLMNLAVNARDAMPRGGRLLIETSLAQLGERAAAQNPEAVPGRYVCVSVSDSGDGIPPEVLPHIFEPFFTTKGVGKGTGLGLATVFGIVKQHRGVLEVRSEAGHGARFQVFLPEHQEQTRPTPPRERREVPGGSETVLLVEDEAVLRAPMRSILERRGYRVLEAADGDAALALWLAHRDEVSLLLTDMVMPGSLDGPALAKRLREEAPALKVLFTSGYSADVAGRELKLEAGQDFLQKPALPAQLLDAVRRCLDGEAPG